MSSEQSNAERKAPRREQWEFGAYVASRDVASLPVIAQALGVHETTARPLLEDLVDQGLLDVVEGVPSRFGTGRGPRVYKVPGVTVAEQDIGEIVGGSR